MKSNTSWYSFWKKILDVSVLGSIFIIITPTHTPQTFISIIDYLLILTIITLCRCSIVYIGHCSKLDIIFISVYEIFSIYSAFAITFVVEGLKTLTNLFLSLKFNKDSWFWIKYNKILKVLIKIVLYPGLNFTNIIRGFDDSYKILAYEILVVSLSQFCSEICIFPGKI